MAVAAAENYHLKWDSHFSYLNSSVATLNEKFADVVLFSSSAPVAAATNVGISAHRFILSACSQFFSTMFENSSNYSSNALLYVILPPELSFRTIQILVQYMYCGEATVSNDILSEVLKGGELLKIRGLCRTTPSNTNPLSSTTTTSLNRNHRLSSHPLPTISKEIYSSSKAVGVNNSQAIDLQFRGIGASVSPNNNPIVVNKPQKNLSLGIISINKDVAIDPGIPVCNVMNCSSCPQETDDNLEFLPNNSNERINRKNSLEHIREDINEEDICHNQGITLQESFEQLLNNSNDFEEPNVLISSPKMTSIKQEPSDWHSSGCSDTHSKDALSSSPHITPISSPQLNAFKAPLPPLAPVKIEADLSSESDDACDVGNDNVSEFESISHLVCQICNETCDDKKSWLRHMSSHRPELDPKMRTSTSPSPESISKHCVPKKRIRKEVTRSEHVTLQCDLCSIPFSSPGDWVRHIHNKHTELELAIYNNKTEQQQLQAANERNTIRRKREATVIDKNQQH